MTQNEWKQKTLTQAIEDKEGTVTLHFGKQIFFEIDGHPDRTDQYGDWEFDLESFFVADTLGIDMETDTVEQAIAKATDYLRKHQISQEKHNQFTSEDKSEKAFYQKQEA